MRLTKFYILIGLIGMIVLAMTIVKPSLSSAEPIEFSDVDRGSSHYEGIYWLVNKGAVDGYPDGTFRGSNPLLRQHAAKLFVGALELDELASSDVTTYFDDVDPTHSYAAYIATVGKEDIFKGDNGNFSPTNQLTREQMATTLVRAFDLKSRGNKVKINLNNVGTSHKENVQILADLKLTTETDDFRPREPVTRAQFASFLYRISEKNVEIINTKYNYSFNTMVEKQMAITGTARPKTDIAATWYEASDKMVDYYANPNNFKEGSNGFYQFLVLSGSAGLAKEELNEILDNGGVLRNQGIEFLKASQTYGVNEIYLIAHSYLETGRGTSDLATGKLEVGLDEKGNAVMVTETNRKKLKDIKPIYNLFGIAANDRCPHTCGSVHAYQQGWFTVEEAIHGGAKFIAGSYFNRGQDTLYKMRWNPNTPGSYQYATDVAWAVKQTSRMREMIDELYDKSSNLAMVFDVPQFNNTPSQTVFPTGESVFRIDSNHQHVGKKATTTATGDGVNFRTVPTTATTFGQTSIKRLPLGTEVTILGENANWYKVSTGDQEGWISGNYLEIDGMKTASYTANAAEPMEEESSSLEEVNGQILEEGVEVRVAPTILDVILYELPIETEVDILGEENGWVKIEFSNQEGWIPVESIKINNLVE